VTSWSSPLLRSPTLRRRQEAAPSRFRPVTRQRLGLDTERSWIITHEVNRFVWPGPDLRPISPGTFAYGLLPRSLYNAVKAAVLEHVRQRTMRQVSRDDTGVSG
jgi:hypothetical protein